MAVVVSDTSPLRAFAQLGLMHVLAELFGEVLVPPAVVRELGAAGSRVAPLRVSDFPFLRVAAPQDHRAVAALSARLDAGEAEAIVLAMERGIATVLIDELAGRAEAMRRGLTPIGVLGLLGRAKAEGLCHQIRPLIDRLESEISFRVAPNLKEQVLRDAHELE